MERFFVDVPVICKQCRNPQCVANCPVDALSKDDNGIIHVDEENCTGCEQCIEACPFGAISIDPLDSTANVCDLCGGAPQCVRWCPTGALKLRPDMSKSQMKRWDAAALPTQSLLKKWGIPREEFEQYYGEP